MTALSILCNNILNVCPAFYDSAVTSLLLNFITCPKNPQTLIKPTPQPKQTAVKH